MKRSSLYAVVLAGHLFGIANAHAGLVTISGVGANLSVETKSITEMRFIRVIKQEHDFSCGSAAVATLLTHHYNRAIDESDVFRVMFKNGDQAKIRKEGFSLLDIRNYLGTLGYTSDGYTLTLDRIAELRVPGIALVNMHGFMHFVVIKGLRGQQVLVGDPAVGLKVIPRAVFNAAWNGIFFVIRDRVDIARAHFNDDSTWQASVPTPLTAGVARTSLADFTLSLPGRSDF